MVSDFRQLSDTVWASPQIALADVEIAANEGFALILNNRPDGESPDQTPGIEIEAAARQAGMAYCAIPITPAGFSREQIDTMAAALTSSEGPVLAYCRSGTRSTLLWSLAQAAAGRDPVEIANAAQQAGYDVSPIADVIAILHAEANG